MQLEHDASEDLETLGDVVIKSSAGDVIAKAFGYQHNKNLPRRDQVAQELVARVKEHSVQVARATKESFKPECSATACKEMDCSNNAHSQTTERAEHRLFSTTSLSLAIPVVLAVIATLWISVRKL